MSYNTDLRHAFAWLDTAIFSNPDTTLSVESLIYQVTLIHPVSPLGMRKRIKSLEKMGKVDVDWEKDTLIVLRAGKK